jgi:hypothetical protein
MFGYNLMAERERRRRRPPIGFEHASENICCWWCLENFRTSSKISLNIVYGGNAMKKLVPVVISSLFVFGLAMFAMADKGSKGFFDAQSGDAVYVCGCGGEGCGCGTLARKEGACSCGKKLVNTTVSRVEDGLVQYTLNGKELSAPQTGKYACGCGEGCGCGTISQKPGTCACGKKLVRVD